MQNYLALALLLTTTHMMAASTAPTKSSVKIDSADPILDTTHGRYGLMVRWSTSSTNMRFQVESRQGTCGPWKILTGTGGLTPATRSFPHTTASDHSLLSGKLYWYRILLRNNGASTNIYAAAFKRRMAIFPQPAAPMATTDFSYSDRRYHVKVEFSVNATLFEQHGYYQLEFRKKNDVDWHLVPPGKQLRFSPVWHTGDELGQPLAADTVYQYRLQAISGDGSATSAYSPTISARIPVYGTIYVPATKMAQTNCRNADPLADREGICELSGSPQVDKYVDFPLSVYPGTVNQYLWLLAKVGPAGSLSPQIEVWDMMTLQRKFSDRITVNFGSDALAWIRLNDPARPEFQNAGDRSQRLSVRVSLPKGSHPARTLFIQGIGLSPRNDLFPRTELLPTPAVNPTFTVFRWDPGSPLTRRYSPRVSDRIVQNGNEIALRIPAGSKVPVLLAVRAGAFTTLSVTYNQDIAACSYLEFLEKERLRIDPKAAPGETTKIGEVLHPFPSPGPGSIKLQPGKNEGLWFTFDKTAPGDYSPEITLSDGPTTVKVIIRLKVYSAIKQNIAKHHGLYYSNGYQAIAKALTGYPNLNANLEGWVRQRQ